MPKTDFHGDTPQREFWRDLKPIEQVFRPGRAAGGLHQERADRRRAVLRAVLRDGRLAAAVDLAEPEPVVRRAVRAQRGPGEPALPPAAGLRVHDLGQVGLPGARLGRDGGRLGVRGAGRGAHARGARARRADEGDVQRHRAADLARRETATRPARVRRLRLHRARVPRALRQGRDRPAAYQWTASIRADAAPGEPNAASRTAGAGRGGKPTPVRARATASATARAPAGGHDRRRPYAPG